MFLDIISFKVIVSNCHKAFINRSQVNVRSANQLALTLSHAGAGEKHFSPKRRRLHIIIIRRKKG